MLTYTYNSQNKVLTKTSSKVDGTQAINLTYSYDVNGNLCFATDGNGVKTEYVYDKLGNKLSETKSGKTTAYT